MKPLSYEHRILLLAVAAGLPGSLIAMILLWTGDYSSRTVWTLGLLIVGLWLGFAISVRHRVAFSLQTLSNLLAAMREEDFSVRGRGARRDDAMGEVMIEVNSLSETLREQRLGALEAGALLRTVMEEIDVAIFTFDNENKLRLVNRAGERLLARPVERLLGFTRRRAGPRRPSRRRRGMHHGAYVSRRFRTLGNAPRIFPPSGPAASPGGAQRSEPRAARRRAPGVAAADSRHGARAE